MEWCQCTTILLDFSLFSSVFFLLLMSFAVLSSTTVCVYISQSIFSFINLWDSFSSSFVLFMLQNEHWKISLAFIWASYTSNNNNNSEIEKERETEWREERFSQRHCYEAKKRREKWIGKNHRDSVSTFFVIFHRWSMGIWKMPQKCCSVFCFGSLALQVKYIQLKLNLTIVCYYNFYNVIWMLKLDTWCWGHCCDILFHFALKKFLY